MFALIVIVLLILILFSLQYMTKGRAVKNHKKSFKKMVNITRKGFDNLLQESIRPGLRRSSKKVIKEQLNDIE